MNDAHANNASVSSSSLISRHIHTFLSCLTRTQTGLYIEYVHRTVTTITYALCIRVLILLCTLIFYFMSVLKENVHRVHFFLITQTDWPPYSACVWHFHSNRI